MLSYPKFWGNISWQSLALYPACVLYKLLGFLRKLLSFETKLPIPVVCVGNITVGGTGKTQVTMHLYELFKKRNLNPIIVSKGYGGEFKLTTIVSKDSDPIIYGDEAVMLAMSTNVVVYKDVKELKAWLCKNKEYNIAIFDDGLQNPYFYKNYKIVTIDGHRGFGNNMLLPSGPLREKPECALNDSTMIMVVSSNCDNIIKIDKAHEEKTIYSTIIPKIVDANFNEVAKPEKVIAFCAIGNPSKFYISLKSLGIDILIESSFPDHYKYTECDIEYLNHLSKENNCKLITTMKDFVKLKNKDYDHDNLLIIKTELSCEDEKISKILLADFS